MARKKENLLEEISFPVQPLLEWYQQNARKLPWRDHPTPYQTWVSEIMLQQTRVEAVKGYYQHFLQEIPDIPALAAVPEDKLLKLWEGLGYYSRARNLQKAARVVTKQHGGCLPASYQSLLTLPGIGSYTAGAIASIAFGVPVAAVDGNVIRVIARLLAFDGDSTLQDIKTEIAEKLTKLIPADTPGMFNQAMMELGATVCLPNGMPKCGVCPIRQSCRGWELGIADHLPIKPKKKPRRIEEKTILLLFWQGKVAIRKRQTKGLLAGLWEFPWVDGLLSPKEAAEKYAFAAKEARRLGEGKHIFTHVEWRMNGAALWLEAPLAADEMIWIPPKELESHYPIPSAFELYRKEVDHLAQFWHK